MCVHVCVCVTWKVLARAWISKTRSWSSGISKSFPEIQIPVPNWIHGTKIPVLEPGIGISKMQSVGSAIRAQSGTWGQDYGGPNDGSAVADSNADG